MKIKSTDFRFLYRKRYLTFIMRTFIFSCCFSVFSITPNSLLSQNTKIVVDTNKVLTIDEVFKMISDQTDYMFIYHEDLFKKLPKVKLNKGIIEISDLLTKTTSSLNVNLSFDDSNTIVIKEKPLVVTSSAKKLIQGVQISGVIVDKEGQPLPGANILEKGTENGTQTDFDGQFSLNVKDENAILVISYIGFTTKEISVKGKTQINITLVENTTSLNEVVLVGYGSQKKSDLTGAISQISAEDFEKQPMVSVDQALQGRLAGVQVTQNNGVPGSGFKIRVRGASSFGSSGPLYVVDGFIGASTGNLAPEDIETINVLKDASATAIYGNRASGGVVIITTKKGKEGKGKIEFNSFISIANPIGEFNLLDGATFAELANRKNIEQGGVAVYTDQDISTLRANGGTDWQDELFQSSITNNYQLALSGGGSGISYYVSASHAKQEGLIKFTDYKRSGLRANINAKINDKVDVAFSAFATRETRRNGSNSASVFGTGNLMGLALTFDPTTPVYDANGDFNLFTINNVASQGQNPFFLASVANTTNYGNYLQSRLALNYKIVKNLDFNISLGAVISDSNTRNYVDPRVQNGNTAFSSVSNGFSYQNINRLTYKNVFNEKHNVSVDVIYEQSEGVNRFTSASAQDFANGGVGSENLALGNNKQVGTGTGKSSLESYIGRVTYGFDDRYLITGSIRSDKSSKFINNPTGIFPSFSLGWNIANEDFFGDSSFITTLKLRGGWGVTGNQNVNSRASFSFLNTGGGVNYIFGGNLDSTVSNGVGSSSRAANPDLTWEETKQTNIGIDFGLLKGKISGSIEYYNKQTEGLLMSRQLANFTGLTHQFVNAAAVENKGFEFSITAYPLKTEDFSWEIGTNLSANKNKVLELVDGLDQIALGGDFNSFSGAVTIAKVGEPLGSFYGYEYTGPDATTGDATYRDVNGDGAVDAENDRVILGNGNPDFIFGINNTLTYKNIDFNVFVQALQGNEIYNAIGTATFGHGALSRHSTNPRSLDAWTPTNTDTNIPRLNSTVRPISSFSIEDGSFIRLKNISLGYNLPAEVLNTIGVSSAKIYVSGQNLVTWTDYSGFDPEVSSGGSSDIDPGVDNGVFPNTKTITLGLNVNF